MRCIVIDQTGAVVNTILAAANFKLEGFEVIPNETGEIGDFWDGSKVVPKEPEPLDLARDLTPKQFKFLLALVDGFSDA